MTDQRRIKLLKIKRSPTRITIILSESEEPLEISNDIITRHKLVEGIILTESQLRILQNDCLIFQADRKAARSLAMRQHSVGELIDKLKLKKYPEPVINEVIKKYRALGILDDAKYALNLAERMLEQRPCGKPMLLAHLYRKKIGREIAAKVTETVLRSREETELALASLEKRWKSFSQNELETAQRKAYNYLSRRGFTYQAARTAFETLSKNKQEENSN